MGKIDCLFSGKSERIAVDVGANLGLYCELLAPHFREVIAVEPQPRLVDYLKRMLPKNVRVLQVAASDQQGQAGLHIPLLPGLSSKSAQQDALASLENLERTGDGKAAETISVELTTIDAVVGDADVGFIKIDVEGHETAAVRGALQTIDRSHPVFLIEIARQMNANAATVFDLLQERGYAAYYVKGDAYVPISAGELDAVQSDEDYARLMRNEPTGFVANFFFFPAGMQPPQA